MSSPWWCGRRGARRVLALGAGVALSAAAVRAGAQEPLSESQAIARAAAQNPSLRAALLQAESDRWAVRGEEGRYSLVYQADAGFTRTATPALSGDTVRTGAAETVEIGTGIRQHLVYGTDLSLRLEGSWLLQHSNDFLTGEPTTLGPGWGVGLRFVVVQPLLRGAGEEVGSAPLKAAEARQRASQRAAEQASSALLSQVATSYWELWYAARAIDIERQSLALTQRQRDDAAARIETGTSSPADVLAFETRLAQGEEALEAAELDRRERRTALGNALGESGGRLVGEPGDEPPLPDPPPSDVAERALAASPDVLEAEAALELARVQARTASDAYQPRLDLDASLEARGLGNANVGAAFEQFGTLGALSAHVGLTFELPIDTSQERAAAAQAWLAVEVAEQRLEQVRQRVAADAESAVQQQATLRRRLELAQRTVTIAEQQLDAQRQRFQSGDAPAVSVLTAEDDLRTARLRVTRARVDLVSSAVRIDDLTGELLKRYAPKLADATAAAETTAASAADAPRDGE